MPKVSAGNKYAAIQRLMALAVFTLCVINRPAAQTLKPQFQPVNPNQRPAAMQPGYFNDPYREQNSRFQQQGGMTTPGPTGVKQPPAQFLKEAEKEETETRRFWSTVWSEKYQKAFQQFLRLNPDSFSITKAVYLVESTYYDPHAGPTYERFEASIKVYADVVRQIMKKEGLNPSDNTAIMYAIQKLFQQPNIYRDSMANKSFLFQPLHYDFNDFMGDNDWKQMFVTKVLLTGSGQCHNFPLLILCIAEQLHAKAYLSLAPNHSFIQYFSNNGTRYNFETTNGNLVTQTWLMQSTGINATALKNRTYLDSLSSRKLYAHCLGDMLLGCINRSMYYNTACKQITERILAIDSANLTALITQAHLYTSIYRELRQAANNPPQKLYAQYPELDNAYQHMQSYQKKLERLGFQPISRDDYGKWLKLAESEQGKQQSRQEKEQLQREINLLKKHPSTLKNSPKG